jgi:hypothetical protein
MVGPLKERACVRSHRRNRLLVNCNRVNLALPYGSAGAWVVICCRQLIRLAASGNLIADVPVYGELLPN